MSHTVMTATNIVKDGLWLLLVLSIPGLLLIVVGCTPTPPDSRPEVSLPIYDGGDSVRGEQLYDENCSQCHKLQLGRNKKGPQLLGVYGAPAALLEDYKYSEAMINSNWTWDAKTLDTYIKDPLAVMPDTRMQADPIADATDRQDIIAYVSTLGRTSSPSTP